MMALPDGQKSFKIGLAVLIQYRRVTDTQPSCQPRCRSIYRAMLHVVRVKSRPKLVMIWLTFWQLVSHCFLAAIWTEIQIRCKLSATTLVLQHSTDAFPWTQLLINSANYCISTKFDMFEWQQNVCVGFPGFTGFTGFPGNAGPPGNPGGLGPVGSPGFRGQQGYTGFTGFAGPPGRTFLDLCTYDLCVCYRLCMLSK